MKIEAFKENGVIYTLREIIVGETVETEVQDYHIRYVYSHFPQVIQTAKRLKVEVKGGFIQFSYFLPKYILDNHES